MNKLYYFIPLMLCFFSCNNTSNNDLDQPENIEKKTEVITEKSKPIFNYKTGLILSTGLSDEEKEKLNLKENGDFQLINNNQSYFLKGSKESLEKYWGKCVSIRYSNDEIFPKPKNVHHYEKHLLIIDDIEEINSCSLSTLPTKKEVKKNILKSYGANYKTTSYAGKIVKAKRPAPDIVYDYKLELEKPVLNENDPRGDGFLTHSYYLLPVNDQMLQLFEEKSSTKKTYEITGYLIGGFAESTVFQVMDIQ